MAATTNEIERQHETGVRTGMFADMPFVATVVDLDHHSLDTTYYDTKDMRLAKAGITVGRVTSEDGTRWSATLPLGEGRCRDIRFPLVEPERGLVPAELAALLIAHTVGRRLRPCAQVSSERDRRRLTGADGVVLADVISDEVTGRRLGRRAVRMRSWHETAIEPRDGGPEVLKQLAERMHEAGRPRGRQHSPIARILRTHPNRGTAAGLAKKASAAEVIGRYLHDQVAALRAADVAFRCGEGDGVHDLRVSVRRLHSCIRVFGRFFEPAAIRSARAELAWLSDVLGAARDVEMKRQHIDRSLRALPTELVFGPVSAELDRLLARSEAQTANAVRGALTSSRYLALQNRLDDLLISRPYRPDADRRAKKALPRRIAKMYRKVHGAVDDAADAHGDEKDIALHSVRKKVRRLRYACEVAEPVIGKQAKTMRRRCKQIQRTLGDHHDSVEIRGMLRELGAQAHLDGGNGFTFGLLHGQAGERTTRLEEDFVEEWQNLTGTKADRWLR